MCCVEGLWEDVCLSVEVWVVCYVDGLWEDVCLPALLLHSVDCSHGGAE